MDEARITEIVQLKLEIVRVRAKCASIENETIERCAKVAEAHKGKAAKERLAKRQQRWLPADSILDIQAEERGEDIASEIIAAAIRALKKEGEHD